MGGGLLSIPSLQQWRADTEPRTPRSAETVYRNLNANTGGAMGTCFPMSQSRDMGHPFSVVD